MPLLKKIAALLGGLLSLGLLYFAYACLRVAVDWHHLFGRVDGMAYAVGSWEALMLGLLALFLGVVLNPFVIAYRPRGFRRAWAYAGGAIFILLVGAGAFMYAYVVSGNAEYQAAERTSGHEHLRLLAEAARRGHPIAANNLGAIYSNGRIDDRSPPIPVDEAAAAYWIENARVRGQPLAALNTARFLIEGKGTPIDRYKATHAFLQAITASQKADADKAISALQQIASAVSNPRASASSLLALDACDETFCFGAAVTCAGECDRSRQADACDNAAADLYDWTRPKGVKGIEYVNGRVATPACAPVAMSSSNPRHWFQLARGLESAGNWVEAANWSRKAAEAGHTAARMQYGRMLVDGKGVAANPAQGLIWQEKAAREGHPGAAYALASAHLKGQHAAHDRATAFAWMQKAAEQGLLIAEFKLGEMHRDGVGTAVNDAEALRWFRKAAAQNFSMAEHALGLASLQGRGSDRNAAEAYEWFFKAAGHGHGESQLQVGVMLRKGEGVAKNEIEGARWVETAANNGVALADFLMSWLYSEGQGVTRNLTLAEKHLREAAIAGLPDAQAALGSAHINGAYGVEISVPKALDWLRKAADQGNAHSQYALGIAYADGYGVTRDRVEAASWFQKASRQGHQQATARLQTLR